MNKNYVLGIVLAAALGGVIAIGGYKAIEPAASHYNSIQDRQDQVMRTVSSEYKETVPLNLDFTAIAGKAINSVVYIQSTYESKEITQSPYRRYQRGPAIASGSGVIISDDGYIVTNNHVVEDAMEINVTLEDNRRYTAKVVGTDPTTDLALIQIDEQNLAFLPYGNSNDVVVGQWVLAIGNPFNLTSTVTAGIVSAMARNIDILRDNNNNLQIESFIQTDAAVNPGNSGGALINTSGQLVGINTAIASRTGSYTGYSFAVPVNLVKKVMDDLLEFGVVQRGLLGIQIRDVSAQLSKAENLHVVEGVYVAEVNSGSGAEEAGIRAKDVIIAIDGQKVRNTSKLQELVAVHRPGDKVEVLLLRDGKEKTIIATLHNTVGTTAIVERVLDVNIDGALFEEVSQNELNRLGIIGGAKMVDRGDGKWEDADIEEGFIITHVDKRKINSIDDLKGAMAHKDDERVIFLGVLPDGTKTYYSVDW
ncbi:MAG: deoxyribonuclease HsdR [Bacteroidetes bacterium]|nr:MAG: deoxyribonuclease HsdR [Bacteroidota bacterium]